MADAAAGEPMVEPAPRDPVARGLGAHPRIGSRAEAAALATLCLAVMGASLAVAGLPAGLPLAALVPVLAAIAVIDARHFLIPDALNAAGIALGLAYVALAADDVAEGLAAAGIRGLLLGLLFLGLRTGYRALRGRDGLGLGDVKLAVLAGVWLEVTAIPVAIEIAALSALLAYALRRRATGRALRFDGRLPFGLFLAPAVWIAFMIDALLLKAS
ncbi:leader peptidase (prepilin peptidase)/N-methyltransferase [Xanthobacter sp. SG618]|uniref:prepilin peptidase n=1 Tax=Xanthobacter sp. SG618 TaxID=2587121 RepID=UPI00145F0292|nr:A24 family peptidase [Xanthobacter sp. SG618]NMN58599.1 leader peptidase (prepilin peptidase)/N-methyltransferase [Xanthobacter sp. SG618]